MWDKATWIGCEVRLKLSKRDKPHFGHFSVAELKICEVQVLFNKEDVVIFVVDVVALIERDLLGNGTEKAAFILDRLVHNAHRIEMREESMRKIRGKPDSSD